MKIISRNAFIMIVLCCLMFLQCAHPNENSMHRIFERDMVDVRITSFFDERGNRDVENLDVKIALTPPKALIQKLSQTDCSVKYDSEGEKKTKESLDSYINNLKSYTRFVFDFTIDSIKCKVFATDKFDVIHIILLNKYNNNYHFIHESYFVYGTILKITEKEMKSNNGDFDDINVEKTVLSLFDENKLFYKSEEKGNDAERTLQYNDGDAFSQMQDAFLLRQFCRDVLLKLKETNANWFLKN